MVRLGSLPISSGMDPVSSRLAQHLDCRKVSLRVERRLRIRKNTHICWFGKVNHEQEVFETVSQRSGVLPVKFHHKMTGSSSLLIFMPLTILQKLYLPDEIGAKSHDDSAQDFHSSTPLPRHRREFIIVPLLQQICTSGLKRQENRR